MVSTPLPSKGSSISGCRSALNTPVASTGEVSATTLGSRRSSTSPNNPLLAVVTREMPYEARVARMPRLGGTSATTLSRTWRISRW